MTLAANDDGQEGQRGGGLDNGLVLAVTQVQEEKKTKPSPVKPKPSPVNPSPVQSDGGAVSSSLSDLVSEVGPAPVAKAKTPTPKAKAKPKVKANAKPMVKPAFHRSNARFFSRAGTSMKKAA